MLHGNRKIQRITVGVIIGVIVISLGLSLLSAAAAPLSRSGAAGARGPAADAVATTAPSPAGAPLGRTDPKPVTRTPQGEATQVSDNEHVGGLVAYIAFMLGGVLLLARSRRRTRKPATENPDFVVTATS